MIKSSQNDIKIIADDQDYNMIWNAFIITEILEKMSYCSTNCYLNFHKSLVCYAYFE